MLNVPSRMKTLTSLSASGAENYWVNVEAFVLDLAELTLANLIAEAADIVALVPDSILERAFAVVMATSTDAALRTYWSNVIEARLPHLLAVAA